MTDNKRVGGVFLAHPFVILSELQIHADYRISQINLYYKQIASQSIT